jgi:hypothetical protein
LLFNIEAKDWSEEGLARRREQLTKTEDAAKKAEESRIANTQASHSLAKYVGTYGGPLFGEAKITEESGKLVVRFVPSPVFVGDLEHWHFDTFRIQWRDSVAYPFPKGLVTFSTNQQGIVEEMKIDMPNPDFDFKELDFKRLAEPTGQTGR